MSLKRVCRCFVIFPLISFAGIAGVICCAAVCPHLAEVQPLPGVWSRISSCAPNDVTLSIERLGERRMMGLSRLFNCAACVDDDYEWS